MERFIHLRPDLLQLVAHFAPPAPLKVLELGCGKGHNATIFAERGDDYTGMDLEMYVRPEFRDLGEFVTGDYCKSIPTGFDLICERGSFICNPNEALFAAVQNVLDALNPRGIFISADLYTEGNFNLREPQFRSFTREFLEVLYRPFETIHFADTVALHRFDFVGRKR